MMKNEQLENTQKLNQSMVNQDLTNMKLRTMNELQNEFNYKNKFVRKDQVMQQRQNQFQDTVMSPFYQKQNELQYTINKREQDYMTQQEFKEKSA